jgi:predicted MFS family arabinose efflux permease
VVYAIPGAVGLVALFANHRHGAPRDRVFLHLLASAAGLLLQALPHPVAVLAGRAIFGWALFQLVVQLETQLFSGSTPASYARDFSRFNFFQQLGALLSSFAAGALVQRLGTEATFLAGAAGFGVGCLLQRVQQARSRPGGADTSLGGLRAG